MKFTVEYKYTENFWPTKRHKNLRIRKMQGRIDVKVKELTETEFPIAFIVHEMKSVCEGMKSYEDYENCESEFKMFAEEIRTYKGELRKPVRITHGVAISTLFRDHTYILENIEYSIRNSGLNKFDSYPYTDNKDEFTEKSIVVSDNKKEVEGYIKNHIKNYIYFGGKFWSVCKEPMYLINTFGLGHNHGGTCMFIENFYNPNISSDNYFNALQREEAIVYGKTVAARRGDTKYIDRIGKHENIEVIMPELVKANPKKEHGKGNEFHNMMESVIENSSSQGEAALVCMALAMIQ